jgi:hypothetical protein
MFTVVPLLCIDVKHARLHLIRSPLLVVNSILNSCPIGVSKTWAMCGMFLFFDKSMLEAQQAKGHYL